MGKVFAAVFHLRDRLSENETHISALMNSLEQQNKELLLAKNEAEKSDEIKGAFLSLISHEIRTPINIIQNYAFLINDYIKSGELVQIQELLPILPKEFARLIRTVDLIVTTAELHTNTYDFVQQEVDLSKIVTKVVNSHMQDAREKGIGLILEIKIEDLIIKTDEYLLEMIIDNLVDNALKFTKQGYVTIKVDKLESRLRVLVTDTGIGFLKENSERIFKYFAQEQSGYTREYEGNGLGLALVKRGSELLGLKFLFKSELNVGSEFTLEFPN